MRLTRRESTPMRDIIPATPADLLASTALAHVATISRAGAPQSSPVWLGWDGEFLRFAQVTGYQQKVRNLQREPRVALQSSTRRMRIATWRCAAGSIGSKWTRIRRSSTRWPRSISVRTATRSASQATRGWSSSGRNA